MKIFLSHTHEERNLAEVFKNLIEKISCGQIKAWYSSDPRPSDGVGKYIEKSDKPFVFFG